MKMGYEKWQETYCFLENQKILNTKLLYQIKGKRSIGGTLVDLPIFLDN